MTKVKSPGTTARIEKACFCGACGWPIVSACCNDEMTTLHPGADWWMYCTNQGCSNHEGGEYNQGIIPSFVRYIAGTF